MDKITVKVLVAKIGIPNVNGLVYPLEEMEQAIAEYNNRDHPQFLTVENDKDLKVNLSKIVGIVERLYIEGDSVYADLTPTDTPMKKAVWCESNLRLDCKPRFIGSGIVEEDKTVKDLRINHVNVYCGKEPKVSWEE